MNEDRNQDRARKQQARKKAAAEWHPNLNADHLGGQDGGRQSDAHVEAEWTAFHQRKRGTDPGGMNSE